MKVLHWNGFDINTLQELRENVDPDELRKAFADGSLEQWLRDRYYEREADAVNNLQRQVTQNKKRQKEAPSMSISKFLAGFMEQSDTAQKNEQEEETMPPDVMQKIEYELCLSLGVNYADAGMMTTEQKADYDRKLGMLCQLTEDTTIHKLAVETATNQGELARLLKCGYSTVVLCNAVFSIPITKGGIHYICVGNVTLENAFTFEQFRRAGITVEGVKLPDTTGEAQARIAKEAAKRYGYDDFDDDHNAFASLVHQTLSTSACWCDNFMQDACFASIDVDFFRTAFQARHTMFKVIDLAYDQAEAYFAPDSKNNVAGVAAQWYERKIVKLQNVLTQLSPSVPKEALKIITELTDQAIPELRRQFNQELKEDSSYYKMYKRGYFYDKPKIESICDPTESELANIFLRPFLFDGDNYAIEGLIDTVSEIQEDMDSRAKTFSGRAHDLYCDYCKRIEEAAQELGDRLADVIMEKITA